MERQNADTGANEKEYACRSAAACSPSSLTPETDQLLECDQYKVDDDGAEYSAYRRMAEHAKQMERERNEAQMMRNWDNRAISIARHYGHEDTRRKNDFEDGRIRPAHVLEKAVAVAIDAWVFGNSVTIQLCCEEVEQWVALVCVHGQDVTAFSADETGLVEDVQEVWMSSGVLAALDHARAMPAESDSPLNTQAQEGESLS